MCQVQSGMSVHDSIVLMVVHLLGISVSLFASSLCLDSQSVMNSCDPGLYSSLVLHLSFLNSAL